MLISKADVDSGVTLAFCGVTLAFCGVTLAFCGVTREKFFEMSCSGIEGRVLKNNKILWWRREREEGKKRGRDGRGKGRKREREFMGLLNRFAH